MADIFFSYARDDAGLVRKLVSLLEAEGLSTWWDAQLRAGSRFDARITEELHKARCVVVLWSPASCESDWVKDEAEEGKRAGKLVPLVLRQAQPPLGFRRFHALDFTGWDGNAQAGVATELLDAVTDLCGATRAPAAGKAATLADVYAALPAVTRPQDPQKGRFGSAEIRDGRILHAAVTPTAMGSAWCWVVLDVHALPGAPALQGGSVFFFVHDSMMPSAYEVPVGADGHATLSIAAWGAFTAGAVADAGRTRLELDLADRSKVVAPADWQAR